MATLQLAYNNSSWTQYGNVLSGTVMNTGFQVKPTGSKPFFDIFVTGTDTIGLNGGFYGSTGGLTATLLDTSGNLVTGIGTNPINPTITTTNSTVVQTSTYFSGLTPATTYWLRLQYNGTATQIIQSDKVVQLSSATTTPSVSPVTGYNSSQIYGFASTFDGVINISSKVGMEGNIQSLFTTSEQNIKNELPVRTTGASGAKIRFKGSFTDIWVCQYGASANEIHLQTVPLNGSSGIPTPIVSYINGTISQNIGAYNGPWIHIATGLNSAAALYELVIQGVGACLISAIMTSGGTGIDTTTTTAGLTRARFVNFIGDSQTQQDFPSGTLCWLMSNELISQTTNNEIVNCGVDGESLVTMAATVVRITEVTTGAVPVRGIVFREGINDIKSGSPPTVAQLSAAAVSFINQVRAKGGGWAKVPIWVEGIIPYSGMTYLAINAFNKGPGGKKDIVAQFNAGTASGQSPAAPDLNVYYIDIDSWNLGGAAYVTGGSFDGTNYADGLHLNLLGTAIEYQKRLAYLYQPNSTVGVVSMTGVQSITL